MAYLMREKSINSKYIYIYYRAILLSCFFFKKPFKINELQKNILFFCF